VCFQVLDGGLRSSDSRLGLANARPVVVVFDQDQQVPDFNALEVTDGDFADVSLDLGAQRGDVGPDVGVVGGLGDAFTNQDIPAEGKDNRESSSDRKDPNADRGTDLGSGSDSIGKATRPADSPVDEQRDLS
jgi:hypothetical protein